MLKKKPQSSKRKTKTHKMGNSGGYIMGVVWSRRKSELGHACWKTELCWLANECLKLKYMHSYESQVWPILLISWHCGHVSWVLRPKSQSEVQRDWSTCVSWVLISWGFDLFKIPLRSLFIPISCRHFSRTFPTLTVSFALESKLLLMLVPLSKSVTFTQNLESDSLFNALRFQQSRVTCGHHQYCTLPFQSTGHRHEHSFALALTSGQYFALALPSGQCLL